MATYASLTKKQTFAIERKALINAKEEFVLDRFTSKKTMPQKSGNSLNFHYWEHIDESGVYELVEGQTPLGTEMVRVPVSGALKDQGAWVPFTDKLMREHENAGEFHKETGAELGYVLGRVLERDMFKIALAGAGTVLPMTNIDADLKLVRQALRKANAPQFTSIKSGSTKVGTKPVNAGWYGFASLNDCDIFRGAADFLSVEDYGYSDNIAPNEIGAIKSLGLRIIETDYLEDGAALFLGEDGVASLGLSGKNKIEYIVQNVGEGGDDPLKQRGTSGVKTQVGAVVLHADRVVKLATTAESANAGPDKSTTVNADVALEGSTTAGATGTTWNVISSPSASNETFSDINSPTSNFQADMVGEYVLELYIDNGVSDRMTVTVS